ncbi:MAG: FeoA domain-containing protein [Bacilli bacterium]
MQKTKGITQTVSVNTLNNLKQGQKARVLQINGGDLATKQRLLDMGITRGIIITINKVAPLGDPICLELRGYRLLVRKDDVKNVEIEVIA